MRKILIQHASLHLSLRGTEHTRYSVIAPPGHPLHGYRIGIDTFSQAKSLLAEYPAHLACPAVWTAAAQRKGGTGFAWAGGYIAIQKLLLPHHGPFISVKALRMQTVPCPYTSEGERQAFFEGVKAYLSLFKQAYRQLRQPAAQADTQPTELPVAATGTQEHV